MLTVLVLIPTWLWVPLLVLWAYYGVSSYLQQESWFGAGLKVRPLTPWDVPDYAAFRQQLKAACEEMGLPREPVWVVIDEESPNAVAVGGRRGLVGFTKGLLRGHPQEEILAVTGHELKHLAARDSLPAIVGGAWLGLLGRISYLLEDVAAATPGVVAGLIRLFSLVLDIALWLAAWVAEAVMAHRSRGEEHLADLAGARLTSAETMIGALERLERWDKEHHTIIPSYARWSPGWIAWKLYASHPPTPDRVRYLRAAAERGELRA
jgi:heat shock protein HtpX